MSACGEMGNILSNICGSIVLNKYFTMHRLFIDITGFHFMIIREMRIFCMRVRHVRECVCMCECVWSVECGVWSVSCCLSDVFVSSLFVGLVEARNLCCMAVCRVAIAEC